MTVDALQAELTSRHIVEGIDNDLHSRVTALINQGFEQPSLTMLSDNPDHLPSLQYMGMKQRIAFRLGMAAMIEVEHDAESVRGHIEALNADDAMHGMIVQLPLKQSGRTDELVNRIHPEKDVDGLGKNALHEPATPLAILNLLEGYEIDYRDIPVTILGRGKLVGEPLIRLLEERGATQLQAHDKHSSPEMIQEALDESQLIVSAVGRPGLLTPESFSRITVPRILVDAGTAEQDGVVRGDVSDDLRAAALEKGWSLTPVKGGVGPLTVRALLSNTVAAAEHAAAAS